ncbi:hypothetical protein BOSE21B_100047 [Bosea sp. 21B]|nr:hypothetical protein BOSE21B_100047 [Bosea sp. 21B]CAD5286888.1 hypothetical protein BOSE7B_41481 [Bosea sp. 7B]
MPIRQFHGVEHFRDETVRHILVEQVGHRVHEDHLRLPPTEWLLQAFGPERQIESVFERVSRHAAKALREPFRVAVIAAGTDLRAPGDRVPRSVGPLDRCVLRHMSPRT